MKVCDVCGNSFTLSSNKQLRCSPKCSKKARNKKDLAALLVPVPCVVCKEPFERKSLQHTCCYKVECKEKKARTKYRPLYLESELTAAKAVNKFLLMRAV